MIPKPEVWFCQKAREVCKIPLTATKESEEAWNEKRDTDNIVEDGQYQKIRASVLLADSL